MPPHMELLTHIEIGQLFLTYPETEVTGET